MKSPNRIVTGSVYTQSDVKTITLEGYERILNRPKYEMWRPTTDKQVAALWKNISIMYDSNTKIIEISTSGINGPYDESVEFNSTNFPGLIDDSLPNRFIVLPWTRNMTTSQSGKEWRLCIITNRGQIYHNFPKRAISTDGTELAGDIVLFEESAIWDLPERKFPSTNPSASGSEKYFPCLPSSCYEYHPVLNDDPEFIDPYGNGGFGKSITKTVGEDEITFPRFYVPDRNAYASNPFSFMSGFEPNEKVSAIGTYQPNINAGQGTRTGVFLTSDGGRNWWLTYEFSDRNESYRWQNWSPNVIDTTDIATAYTPNSFVVQRRKNNIPGFEGQPKEPLSKFTFLSDIVVTDITRGTNPVVSTAESHGLANGQLVRFKLNTEFSGERTLDWDWMLNETADENDGGTGTFFKIEHVTATSFKLHEYIHSIDNNIPCRHIHHISWVKDGMIIGTGETHPEGWFIYMKVGSGESFGIKNAWDNFEFIRLNSLPEGISRPLGTIMLEDDDSTLVIGSDSGVLETKDISLPLERTGTFKRASMGVYSIKLADADDISKAAKVYEATQVCYYFKERFGVWVYIGQLGEFAVSFDKGDTWYQENLVLESSIMSSCGYSSGVEGQYTQFSNGYILITR